MCIYTLTHIHESTGRSCTSSFNMIEQDAPGRVPGVLIHLVGHSQHKLSRKILAVKQQAQKYLQNEAMRTLPQLCLALQCLLMSTSSVLFIWHSTYAIHGLVDQIPTRINEH